MFKSILRLERINEEDNLVMYQYQGKGVTKLIHYKQCLLWAIKRKTQSLSTSQKEYRRG